MKSITLFLISAYQKTISPFLVGLFGQGCRFRPTCSQYSKEAISKYGSLKGSRLALARILKCHPLSKGGFEPLT